MGPKSTSQGDQTGRVMCTPPLPQQTPGRGQRAPVPAEGEGQGQSGILPSPLEDRSSDSPPQAWLPEPVGQFSNAQRDPSQTGALALWANLEQLTQPFPRGPRLPPSEGGMNMPSLQAHCFNWRKTMEGSGQW